MEGKGVDISHVRILEGATPVTKVTLCNGDRVLGEYAEEVMTEFRLHPEDIDFLSQHDIVVTGLWGKVEGNLAELCRSGVQIAFDFADRPEDAIVEIAIPYVDYAFFSFDKGDTPALRCRMQELQAKGPKVVVATMGAKGSIAWDGNCFVTCEAVPCTVVDTMGAGDSFIAGFLCGILEGLSLEACMKKGAQNSAVTLGYFGAW